MISRFSSTSNRRRFLETMGLGGLFFTVRGAFAQALVQTPAQTLGPYYPDRMPLDQDNDLLVINDNISPAVGEILWVAGRVLDSNGSPVRGALIEIWQADINGAYIHSGSTIANRDANFQGYGRFQTGSTGEYLFRTVRPGLYPGRTRHIHAAVTPPGRSRLVTQIYQEGESRNSSDGVLNGIRDSSQRASVIVPWTAVEGSMLGELAARFDFVMGFTPVENAEPSRPVMVSMVNGATLHPGVASGSWVTVYGSGLSSTTNKWDLSGVVDGRLPESLDGVSVQINNQPAAVSYVSPAQLNVLAPVDSINGEVRVSVTNSNGASDEVAVDFQTYMPGFFLTAQEYVLASRPDGSVVAPAGLIEGTESTPAQPGETVALFGTGFGPTDPQTPSGQVVEGSLPLVNQVKIQIDTTLVDVSYAALSSAGMYQFHITVPDLPDGDHSVSAEVAGIRTKKIGRIRVAKAA